MFCVLNYVSFVQIKVPVRTPGDTHPASILDIIALYFLELFDWRFPGNAVANANLCPETLPLMLITHRHMYLSIATCTSIVFLQSIYSLSRFRLSNNRSKLSLFYLYEWVCIGFNCSPTMQKNLEQLHSKPC